LFQSKAISSVDELFVTIPGSVRYLWEMSKKFNRRNSLKTTALGAGTLDLETMPKFAWAGENTPWLPASNPAKKLVKNAGAVE
jgi:hypothetical protein